MSEPASIESPRIATLRRGLARKLERVAASAILIPFLFQVGWHFAAPRGIDAPAFADPALGLGALAAVVLGVAAFVFNRSWFAPRGVIRCDRNDLVIERGGLRRVPLAEVETGFVVPTRAGTSVELHLKGGDVIDVGVRAADEAAALLRSARVDVARQRCRIQLVDQNARLFIALFTAGALAYCSLPALGILAVLFRGDTGALVWACLLALSTVVALRGTALPELTIGTDGIAFKRGFRETFVPFEELVEIRPAGLGILVRTRDGRSRTIFSPAGVGPERFEALLLRIREAMAARAQGRQPALELLDRRGRSVREWRVALAEVARRGTSYRDVGISIDDLEAVIGSPDATPERRLAAAVALRAAAHPAATSLIRVAAAQCASQRLRVALEKVGEGDDDDLALAEALGDDVAPPQRLQPGAPPG
ncbi:MAG: hypothetical protein ABJE95_09090 [Byssovorax sp.]